MIPHTPILSLLIALAHANHLTLTALLSDDAGRLRFECWAMKPTFRNYPTVGSAVKDFAEVSNISYVVLPPKSSEGYHKPPHPMFFVLVSGLAHITIPGHSDEELWMHDGIMIAADMIGEGHVTEYASESETHALQIPFKDGKVPEHQVVREGICHTSVGSDNVLRGVKDDL